tara:strand:- start:145026 stop:146318 length:1293 start_codon:yes stop_codon:yes gene_type:complete
MKKIIDPGKDELIEALKRPALEQKDLTKTVVDIFKDVQLNGDSAIRKYAQKFDQVKLETLRVTEDEVESAKQQLAHELKSAIMRAAENITAFHESQKEPIKEVETFPGVKCWRKSVGIDKVGLYIPGGTAPLFSTVLMLGIPAKIAGCQEVVLCTPSDANGEVHPAILYAADLIGINKIFKVGGIQAIAAMTYGTESIPSVYKVFGPGNQYVTAAKQYAQQIGVAIDMPAGPSEVMVVADKEANPSFIAADLLSQAEHGADSQVILLTDDTDLLDKVEKEIKSQLDQLNRKALAEQSLKYAKLIAVQQDQLVDVINDYAPEHLILSTRFNDKLVQGIRNAGSVFIGDYTPESLGDYASGTNHTLPTNGFARMHSGVSLDSFVKKITYQQASKDGLTKLGPVVETMAEAEELTAHKNAVSLRLKAIHDERD